MKFITLVILQSLIKWSAVRHPKSCTSIKSPFLITLLEYLNHFRAFSMSLITRLTWLRPIYTVQFLLTTVACDFYSALLASWKNRIRFPRYQIACRYDCRRVLKHVSKAHDILRVVRDNRKQVVGLIYTNRFMWYTRRKFIACDKVVPCKSAFRGVNYVICSYCMENFSRVTGMEYVIIQVWQFMKKHSDFKNISLSLFLTFFFAIFEGFGQKRALAIFGKKWKSSKQLQISQAGSFTCVKHCSVFIFAVFWFLFEI